MTTRLQQQCKGYSVWLTPCNAHLQQCSLGSWARLKKVSRRRISMEKKHHAKAMSSTLESLWTRWLMKFTHCSLLPWEVAVAWMESGEHWGMNALVSTGASPSVIFRFLISSEDTPLEKKRLFIRLSYERNFERRSEGFILNLFHLSEWCLCVCACAGAPPEGGVGGWKGHMDQNV